MIKCTTASYKKIIAHDIVKETLYYKKKYCKGQINKTN